MYFPDGLHQVSNRLRRLPANGSLAAKPVPGHRFHQADAPIEAKGLPGRKRLCTRSLQLDGEYGSKLRDVVQLLEGDSLRYRYGALPATGQVQSSAEVGSDNYQTDS